MLNQQIFQMVRLELLPAINLGLLNVEFGIRALAKVQEIFLNVVLSLQNSEL